MANYSEDLAKRSYTPTIIKNYITVSKEIVTVENKTRPLVRNDDHLKQLFFFKSYMSPHFHLMYSQYSSIGPVFKWKQDQAGTAKAVQSVTQILSNVTRMFSKAKKIVPSYTVSSMRELFNETANIHFIISNVNYLFKL